MQTLWFLFAGCFNVSSESGPRARGGQKSDYFSNVIQVSTPTYVCRNADPPHFHRALRQPSRSLARPSLHALSSLITPILPTLSSLFASPLSSLVSPFFKGHLHIFDLMRPQPLPAPSRLSRSGRRRRRKTARQAAKPQVIATATKAKKNLDAL